MPDLKVSALPAATTATAASEIPINEAGVSKKVTIQQIQNLPFGTGDALSMYNTPVAAQLVGIKKGTAAAPDTSLGALLKVERTLNVADADLIGKGDGVDLLSAISGIAVGTSAFRYQPVGVSGFAKHTGTVAGTNGMPDACGVYGVGRITGTGTGTAIGAYFAARRENDTSKANAVEMHAANLGTVASAYNSTGFSSSQCLWMNCSGNADSAVGIAISNAFGRQFKVGLGFTAQVTGGLTGGVADSSIRDDSSAVRSIDIRGTHTYGIDMNAAALTIPIRLKNDSYINALNAAGSSNQTILGLDAADFVVIGSGPGVAGIKIIDRNIALGATTGTKIGTATTQKLSFWNATPAIQPSAVPDATGGAVVDVEARAALNALLARMRTVGMVAV